ncbi:DMT family transporter [Ruegeria marina]|uniref:EamA-like transporter family protein n=1 Tax=Ruegeria marina TaxID=639004 RepID=A0A1G6P6B2_9RHOB|nr:DMT family transporter [Ruegeria marina]SDC75780.1 EamA-like transporter family protein [Ruegeria marina]
MSMTTLQPSMPGRPVLSGNALAIGSMITWSAGLPAAQILLESWPPLTLSLARMLLGLTVLVPVWLLREGRAPLMRTRWGRALWIGALGFGIGPYLLLEAQKLTDPVTVALIVSCAPLIGTALELAAGTRRLTGAFALGVAASVLGGLIATSALAPAQLGFGALLAVLSTGIYCWASLASVRDLPGLSDVGRTAATLAGGLLASTLLLALFHAAGAKVLPRIAIDLRQVVMLLIYSVVALAVSQALFVAAIARLGVAVSTFHINVTPFYVMLIMLALGEPWDWTRALGAAIVASGVILSQMGVKRLA